MPAVALSYAVAFVIAFVLTYIRPIDETAAKSEKALAAEKKLVIKVEASPADICAPAKGTMIELSEVNDKTFARCV